MAILRPYLHSPGGSLLPPTPGPFRGPRGARLAPKRRRGEPASPMAIAITSPPSSRTDTGILAQQSDVCCKRGRLGVIMIVPAAHTFKGLAKAFVSWCVPPGARGRISLFNSSGPSFPKEKRKNRPALPRKRVTETRCSSRTLRAKPGRLHHSLYHVGYGN